MKTNCRRLSYVCLFLTIRLWAGESKQEKGWAILEKGAEHSLDHVNATPYHLEASFTFARAENDPVPGTYKLTWISPERWRRDIDVGNLQELAVGGKNKLWIQRSLAVEPLLANRLNHAIGLLRDLQLNPEDKIESVRNQKRDYRELQCVESKDRKTPWSDRTACFDTSTGALASVQEGLWSYDYSDVQQFGTRAVPTTIRVGDQGRVRVEVRVGKMIDCPGMVDDSLFAQPAHAQEWVTCEKPIHETFAVRVPPSYPEHERQSHRVGTVVMYDIIAADGSIEKLKVIESAGPLFDEAAMKAVKQWKYNPAICDGVPIRKESEVQINFTLSP